MTEEKINILTTALNGIKDERFNDIALFLINNMNVRFSSIYKMDEAQVKDHNYDMVMASKVLLDEKTIDEEIESYQNKIDVLKFIKKQREQSDYGTIYF